MKRLTDLDAGHGHELDFLVELVRAQPPFAPDPFRRRRVHTRLFRRLAQQPRRFGRSVLVAVLLGAVAASAAAAWGVGWAISSSAPAATPSPRLAAIVAPAPAPRAPGIDGPQPAAPAGLPASSAFEHEKPAKAAPRRPAPARALAPRDAEDPARVVRAMRALRRDNDPVRAQELLAEHQRLHPRGALSEEVLALSIEAAAARRDPKARDYARRYLAQYPMGRFRELAQRTLAGSAK